MQEREKKISDGLEAAKKADDSLEEAKLAFDKELNKAKEDAAENSVTEDEVIDAAKTAAQDDKTIIFEMQAHDDPMKLLDYVRLASTVYGASYIFIDHVQRLAYLSNAGVEGATSTLTTLGARMAQLAKELNIGVIFISQVNDDGRTKYAASLEEEAIVCVKLSRDTEAEEETERNTTYFIVDKNRPYFLPLYHKDKRQSICNDRQHIPLFVA